MVRAQSDPILQRFLPKAQAGDAQAQYLVGSRYYQLHDIPNAKLWLQKSAAQGNQQAAGFLKYQLGGGSSPSPSPSPPGGVITPAGTGLCPGTGRTLEPSGALGALQDALRQIPTSSKAQLSQIMLMSQGVCQYTFVLTAGQVMTFADVPGDAFFWSPSGFDHKPRGLAGVVHGSAVGDRRCGITGDAIARQVRNALPGATTRQNPDRGLESASPK
jgi:hypothetical protein